MDSNSSDSDSDNEGVSDDTTSDPHPAPDPDKLWNRNWNWKSKWIWTLDESFPRLKWHWNNVLGAVFVDSGSNSDSDNEGVSDDTTSDSHPDKLRNRNWNWNMNWKSKWIWTLDESLPRLKWHWGNFLEAFFVDSSSSGRNNDSNSYNDSNDTAPIPDSDTARKQFWNRNWNWDLTWNEFLPRLKWYWENVLEAAFMDSSSSGRNNDSINDSNSDDTAPILEPDVAPNQFWNRNWNWDLTWNEFLPRLKWHWNNVLEAVFMDSSSSSGRNNDSNSDPDPLHDPDTDTDTDPNQFWNRNWNEDWNNWKTKQIHTWNRIQNHLNTYYYNYNLNHYTNIKTTITTTIQEITKTDIPRTFKSLRKRLDLLGNDYYLAHIYRTLHWWSRPTHVTVLGDLLGSQWIGEEEFERRGNRYWKRVFRGSERVDDDITWTGGDQFQQQQQQEENDSLKDEEVVLNGTKSTWSNRLINIVGNHDIGYAGDINEERINRFEKIFGRVNWDIRFRLPQDEEEESPPPTIHIINLNSLILDSPALSEQIQAKTYWYLNNLLTYRSYPVEDSSSFTLLLTHVPLYKKEGICVDGPKFEFYQHHDHNESESENENEIHDPEEQEQDDDQQHTHTNGPIKEQNHLSKYISSAAILEGIFGFGVGDKDTPPRSRHGRNGLILTGHDHEGCDVVHFLDRSSSDGGDSLKWNVKPYTNINTNTNTNANNDIPSIREITLRSMMGEYGGNAGLLSIWFLHNNTSTSPTNTDNDNNNIGTGEWKYEFTTCQVGVQHIWWATHVIIIVTFIVLGFWVLLLSV